MHTSRALHTGCPQHCKLLPSASVTVSGNVILTIRAVITAVTPATAIITPSCTAVCLQRNPCDTAGGYSAAAAWDLLGSCLHQSRDIAAGSKQTCMVRGLETAWKTVKNVKFHA
jgi:hypothetical protein